MEKKTANRSGGRWMPRKQHARLHEQSGSCQTDIHSFEDWSAHFCLKQPSSSQVRDWQCPDNIFPLANRCLWSAQRGPSWTKQEQSYGAQPVTRLKKPGMRREDDYNDYCLSHWSVSGPIWGPDWRLVNNSLYRTS